MIKNMMYLEKLNKWSYQHGNFKWDDMSFWDNKRQEKSSKNLFVRRQMLLQHMKKLEHSKSNIQINKNILQEQHASLNAVNITLFSSKSR